MTKKREGKEGLGSVLPDCRFRPLEFTDFDLKPVSWFPITYICITIVNSLCLLALVMRQEPVNS